MARTAHDIPKWKEITRNVITGIALGGTALGLSGCAPEEKPPEVATATQTPPQPANTDKAPAATPNAETGQENYVPAKGDYLSPDSLAQLESPDTITEAFQIKADQVGTPEDLAQLITYRDEAFINAGTTPEEQKEAGDDVSVYIDRATARYHTAAMKGMYYDPAKPGAENYTGYQTWNHNALLVNGRSFSYKGGQYHIDKRLDHMTVVEGSIESGEITLRLESTFSDNMEEIAKDSFLLADFPEMPGQIKTHGKEVKTYQAINVDDVWYTKWAEGEYTPNESQN